MILSMGQNARIRRQRALSPASEDLSEQPLHQPGRFRRLRAVLLGAIPLISIALAIILIQIVESRPAAGMVLLLGCALWITTLVVGVGQDIPRRDRLRYGGLTFGRKQ